MSWLGGLVDKAKSFLGKPAAPVASAHDAIRSTRFDQALFEELCEAAPALQQVVTDLHKDYAHTDDLVRDTLMQFFQAAPKVRDKSEMSLGHLANHAVAQNIAKAPETALTRTYTQHNKYGAAMATIGVSDKVRQYLVEHDELQKAAEAAEQAKQEQQQAQDGLQEAADGAQAADAACDAAMGGYEGEGPLTPEQAQAQADAQAAGETLQQALDALQAATDAAGVCQQQALTEAERAQRALRAPVEQAVAQAAKDLEKEAQLFRGWGLEPGEVEMMSFEERQAMARRLSNHHLSEFIQQLGRWKAMQKSNFAKRVIAARDEVYDVELSGNLSDVIASEFAHLGSDIGQLDFLTRLSDNQLIVRKYRGDERMGQGPIICLVDTSGSMKTKDRHGSTRELFAKGTALAMLDQARAEKRDFVGIIFASDRTAPVVYRFPKGQGDIDQVLEFTAKFLNGGTDFQRPLDLAMDLLEETELQDGDLVLLTDDECKVSDEWLAGFKARKEQKNTRIWGLAIGLKQPGSTLESLADNVRSIEDFTDPSQIADMVRTI